MNKEQKALLTETNISVILSIGLMVGVARQSLPAGILGAAVTAVLIAGHTYDWWVESWEVIRPYRAQFVVWLRGILNRGKQEESTEIDIYDAFFGFMEKTGEAVFQNLANVGHIFIIGMTRYGKTVLAYNILYYLLVNHAAHELEIAFADAKRTSYQIFARIPHLRWPLATNRVETAALLREVKLELDARIKKFEIYAGRRICTNLNEYADLSGERLPRLVVFLDETADLIDAGSQAEKDLESIMKMGLAYGITLILMTQRPTAKGASHEAQSQTDALFCTYMKRSTEYGSVAGIPKAIYSRMTPAKGRFMVYLPDMAKRFLEVYPECEGWGFVKTQLIPNRQIEVLAHQLSNGRVRKVWEPEMLEAATPDMKEAWGGDESNKLRLIRKLHESLGRMPTAVELRKHYAIKSRKTSEVWMQKYKAIYG